VFQVQRPGQPFGLSHALGLVPGSAFVELRGMIGRFRTVGAV
jgi:hypothetical protein